VPRFLLKFQPPSAAIASILPSSCFDPEDDLRKLRMMIRWQASGFNEKKQHGIMALSDMRPGDSVYFSAYTLSGLVLPLSLSSSNC
jgi:hypothetical protein